MSSLHSQYIPEPFLPGEVLEQILLQKGTKKRVENKLRDEMMERIENQLPKDPDAISQNITYPQQSQASRKMKNKMKNKKRFTDEQIKSLESIFESETKLEPRKKTQLARELGLQPRQVAIWFQNKRARWKSKQIEQEYRTLKTNYDNLSSQYESLKKEKQSLLIQLQKLSELLGKPNEHCNASGRSNSSGGSDNDENTEKTEAKPRCMQRVSEEEPLELQVENGGDVAQTGQGEEWGAASTCELQAGSSTLPQRTYGFDSGGIFEQTCSMSHWSNFWA